MTPDLSPNTQAILLLTAPLIIGNTPSADLLSPTEYRRLAIHLRHLHQQPSDLMAADASELLSDCSNVIDQSRLKRLLNRGFLLSQVIEHWQSRGIWVISRADSVYPKRLKARLKENAPAILYGCGNIDLFESGGLAVVGSRNVTEDVIDYSNQIGKLAALSEIPIISGGAKGVDRAAMNGALNENGYVCEVMAERLDRGALNRSNRQHIMNGQLVLVSAYDPSSGFNVGHAMQRNKIIYGLSDASLVVNAEIGKGGTWSGAIEQLEKLHFVRVYVRVTGEPSEALRALEKKGAAPWPDPRSRPDFIDIFERPAATMIEKKESTLSMQKQLIVEDLSNLRTEHRDSLQLDAARIMEPLSAPATTKKTTRKRKPKKQALPPAQIVLNAVYDALTAILKKPMKEDEIAAILDTSIIQTRTWLKRLVEDGRLEKQSRPARYILAHTRLFD